MDSEPKKCVLCDQPFLGEGPTCNHLECVRRLAKQREEPLPCLRRGGRSGVHRHHGPDRVTCRKADDGRTDDRQEA